MVHCPPKKSALASAIIASLATFAPQTHAEVVSGSVSPPSHNIPLNQSASASFVWTVIDTVRTMAATVTVSSSAGEFRDACSGNMLLGRVNTPLSSTKFIPTVNQATAYTFAETLIVPVDITLRAHSLGLSSIVYARTFSDNDNTPTATPCTTLQITSSAAAGFSISRVALGFDGGTPTRIVARRESLRATAAISFTGNGLLQGMWEIATPSSTAGEPAFRPLGTVRQFLVGTNTHNIESPVLPTDSAGLYLLRLRVTDPATSFDAPVIRYFVTDERAGARIPALSLSLVTPPNQILLAPDTAFSWEAIRGARAYQLELYAKPRGAGDDLPDLGGSVDTAPPTLPGTPPVTGVLVPGTQTRALLSGAARAHLVSGQSYLWRVLAIGGDGSIVGESPVRELRMP